jgi:hypothetical protein
MTKKLSCITMHQDKTFPSRTHIIGIIDNSVPQALVYLKKEVLLKKMLENKDDKFVLIASGTTVSGFRTKLKKYDLSLDLRDNKLIGKSSGTEWDVRGKYLKGKIELNLIPLAISDEYWFSWKIF